LLHSPGDNKSGENANKSLHNYDMSLFTLSDEKLSTFGFYSRNALCLNVRQQ